MYQLSAMKWGFLLLADMVELVDTQDLESCEETREGSIPVIRTKTTENAP